MSCAKIIQKMIDFYQGNTKDISHFLKVYAYAKMIGELENVDAETQKVLEIAAIVHDIACPICREKYGNTNGKKQEIESPALLQAFLEEFNLPSNVLDRIIYLVSHHHTYTNVDGLDYQILLEADFLVNADESAVDEKAIETMQKRVFKTKSGVHLLESIYQRTINSPYTR